MEIIRFFSAPLLGGLIALSTNWLAIRMLFRPHREIRLLGARLPFTPGLIPKERARIARKLAEAIGKNLLTPEVFAREMADPAAWPLPDVTVGQALGKLGAEFFDEKLAGDAADRLFPFLAAAAEGFEERHPALDARLAELTAKVVSENVRGLAGLFVSPEKVYRSIKAGIAEFLRDDASRGRFKEWLAGRAGSGAVGGFLAEKVLGMGIKEQAAAIAGSPAAAAALRRLAEWVAAGIPVAGMVEKKIGEFDTAEVEELIISVTGRELRLIVWLGGAVGFAIGLLANVAALL